MADSIRTPPKFDGLNFLIWKVRVIVFLQSLGCWVAKAVTKPYSASTGEEGTWSDLASMEYEANSKAQNALLQALNDDDIVRVIRRKSTHEIWSHLVVTHEGTSQVKKVKIDLLHSQYKKFSIIDFSCSSSTLQDTTSAAFNFAFLL